MFPTLRRRQGDRGPIIAYMTALLEPAHAVLARAGRMLDDLRTAERQPNNPYAFADRLPYVLDLLAGVTRLIDECSKGSRTPEFSQWWKTTDRSA